MKTLFSTLQMWHRRCLSSVIVCQQVPAGGLVIFQPNFWHFCCLPLGLPGGKNGRRSFTPARSVSSDVRWSWCLNYLCRMHTLIRMSSIVVYCLHVFLSETGSGLHPAGAHVNSKRTFNQRKTPVHHADSNCGGSKHRPSSRFSYTETLLCYRGTGRRRNYLLTVHDNLTIRWKEKRDDDEVDWARS